MGKMSEKRSVQCLYNMNRIHIHTKEGEEMNE